MIAAERPALSLAALEAFDPHPTGGGDEQRFCCPLAGCADKPRDRGHQSLCANLASGLWLCNRCQARGKLVERWAARPLRDVRREAALRRIRVQPDPEPGTAETAAVLPERLAACRPLAGTPGQRYLFDRGIGLGPAQRAGVVYAPAWSARPGGRRPAVVFPLRDQAGRVVAANGRYLTVPEGLTKTLTLGDRRLGVFATPGALDGESLVLCEGPFDALSLAAGGAPAVALVGTRAPHWLRRVAAFRRVVVGLDADAEGDEKAALLLEELAPFARSVERLRPPLGKDWNDALLADFPRLCDYLEEGLGRSTTDA